MLTKTDKLICKIPAMSGISHNNIYSMHAHRASDISFPDLIFGGFLCARVCKPIVVYG